MQTPKMIEFDNVIYHYKNEKMYFNFTIQQQESVMILGPSGAGKSTLLNLIAGFIEPHSGSIRLNDLDIQSVAPAKRPVSMLFQDNNLFTHLTVEQNIALGLSPSLKLSPVQKQQLLAIVERIGLQDYLSRYPQQLSGGQRQRVALGRCLVQHRPILLLDEPFSSLDPKLRQEMNELVNEICNEFKLTTLMVSHQFEKLLDTLIRCLVITNGQVAYDGPLNGLLQPQHQGLATLLGL